MLLGIALASCSQAAPPEQAAPEADAAPTSGNPAWTEGALSPLAERATDLMAKLEAEPDHQGLQGAFQEVLQKIYAAEWPNLATPTNRVYGDALHRAYVYAEAGDGAFLEAIMMASFGPYGATAEGSEGFREMLWGLFEQNPSLTIAVLLEIGEENRRRLVDNIYTDARHDYDFAKIARELQVEWPDEIREDVGRIIAALIGSMAETASTEGLGDTAAVDAKLTDDETLQLARQADDDLATWAENPKNTDALQAFFAAFDRIYTTEDVSWARMSPATGQAVGRLLLRVSGYAEEGRPEFLRALIRAGMGPYGQQTAEGGEWTNELCWTAMERDLQATLDVLAGIPPGEREPILASIYLQPVHDAFDFVRLEQRLREAKVADGMQDTVQRMLAAIEPLALQVAPPEARRHVRRGAAAAKRGRRRYQEAIEEYRLAIEMAPYWTELHLDLGLIYMKRGENADAIESFNRYLEMEPRRAPRDLNQTRLLILKLEEEMAPKVEPPPEPEPDVAPAVTSQPEAQSDAAPEAAPQPDPAPAGS